MTYPDQATVTRLLAELQDGDRQAVDRLFGVVYGELRELARRQRRRWHGDYTLNTTALVHEAYLKLVDQERIGTDGREHFYALASKAMRHVLSNYAKRQRAQKRGGDLPKLSLESAKLDKLEGELVMTDERAEALAALDDALARLEGAHPRQAQVVECRFYGGMTVEETAAALATSPATVKRDWAVAQAWLYREMQRETA